MVRSSRYASGWRLTKLVAVYNVDDLSVGATPSSFTARKLATAVNLLRCPFSRPGPPRRPQGVRRDVAHRYERRKWAPRWRRTQHRRRPY